MYRREQAMTMAAMYARVSSARQREEHTIASQTAALRAFAEQQGLDVCDEWTFEDEGFSGATLVRPGLEALRDLVAQVPVEVVLCYAPDRLARRYAYQALLIEEFARAGTEVRFVKAPAGDTPEDQLLVQFQGMIAEYERAQIVERTRRGKLHRARGGAVNVLSGAPFGYRYVRKSDHADACYEIVEHEAAVVRELFRRYTQQDESIAGLCRWLESQGVLTRSGKTRWDRTTVWGMLRNPAYAGRAAFGKTAVAHAERPALNRTGRRAGKQRSTNSVVRERDAGEWIEVAVPAIVDEATFELAARRLADNKRFASRNSTSPSLLRGLVACQSCSYAYYRTSTKTTKRKIVYYRCIGSDGWRHEGGKICDNRPVRADQLEPLVWDHVTRLLTDPSLIAGELERRLAQLRAANPATAQRGRLERDLARASGGIARLLEAYQEQLVTLDELRDRMPELRKREATIRSQLDALDAELVDHETYLKLAENLDSFLARLRDSIDTTSDEDRQRVLRAVVREVLVGTDRVVIRHSIPFRPSPSTPDCHLRWGSQDPTLRGTGGGFSQQPVLTEDACFEERLHQGKDAVVPDPSPHQTHQGRVRDLVEARLDVSLDDPLVLAWTRRQVVHLGDRIMCPTLRTEPVGARVEVRLEDRLQHQLQRGLDHPVGHGRDPQPARLAASLRDHPFADRQRAETAVP
jgi:site-specific DNA recombinase